MDAGNVIVVLGGIAGALTGAISLLFRSLIESKDSRINELIYERDYWRDTVLHVAKLNGGSVPSYEDWLKEHAPQGPPPRPGKA